jgi:hypothetical protein
MFDGLMTREVITRTIGPGGSFASLPLFLRWIDIRGPKEGTSVLPWTCTVRLFSSTRLSLGSLPRWSLEPPFGFSRLESIPTASLWFVHPCPRPASRARAVNRTSRSRFLGHRIVRRRPRFRRTFDRHGSATCRLRTAADDR